MNQTKNSLIALKIENYNLKESVDVKIKKIEDLSTKIKTLEHKIKNIELNVKINKKDVIIKCYKVMHYSYRYNDKYLNETLSNQLLYLNKIS